jgi:tetratricopeptide (TPR) repeat protein
MAALSAQPASSSSVQLPEGRAELGRLVDDVGRQISDGRDVAAARAILDAIIDGPALDRLNADREAAAFFWASYAAILADEPERAHALMLRATDRDPARPVNWSMLFTASVEADKIKDALLSLIALVERWPEQLTRVPESYVPRAIHAARRAPNPDAEIRALSGLFKIRWYHRYNGEPSDLWHHLALLLLERGDANGAREVFARVTDPAMIVRARADKRFDSLRADEPPLFDVAAAAEREVERTRALAESEPDSLRALLVYVGALDVNNRCEEALGVTEQAIARASGPTAEEGPYRDGGEYFPWLLDTRARLLRCLGRWDDALRYRVQAARLTENGGPNVSQVINLASFYADLGRPEDALATIETVGKLRSDYGDMQEQSVRLKAYVQLGDVEGVRSALAFISENRADALGTYQSALLRAERMDAAAALLISRLENPRERADALYEVQDFADRPRIPIERQGVARWSALLARPDVSAAIERVGRRESYPVSR